ncbi:MAG: YbaN family protein [Clostridia bacterium]|nr:YbaN family protein [Clostridia bacterium]
MEKFTRLIITFLGTIFIAFGILGIFLPLIPTTPFLLLGAACYLKGSERLYSKLVSNKILGRYISDYQQGKGIPLSIKIISICLLFTSIGYSTIFIIKNTYVKIILLLIAAGVTMHLLSIKTSRRDE